MSQTKWITQETFDAVVKENIDEFEMDLDEAVEDGKQQFESQGVDLSNIITSFVMDEGSEGSGGLRHSHPVKDALQSIQKSLDANDLDQLSKALKTLQLQCNDDNENRKFATHHGALKDLLSSIKHLQNDPEHLAPALEALSSLINGQADLLDREALNLLFKILKDFGKEGQLLEQSLKVIRYSCIKSESNRQTFVSLDIIPLLIETLKIHKSNARVTKEICILLRVLIFDDDMSVPYGKAHEHAKMIVAEKAFLVILDALHAVQGSLDVVSELCATLGRLFVRDEFCKEFVDMDGLKLVLKLFQENIENQAIAKNVCAMLKTLAGNDDVKKAVVDSKGMDLIIIAMKTHEKLPYVAEQGCAALASISLRNPENCAAIVASGGPEVILKAMQLHCDVVNVQKQGCLALRNLVARNPDNCDPILNAGGETLIRHAYQKYTADCGDLAKAALRDLGCDVELRELWTGQGKHLVGHTY